MKNPFACNNRRSQAQKWEMSGFSENLKSANFDPPVLHIGGSNRPNRPISAKGVTWATNHANMSRFAGGRKKLDQTKFDPLGHRLLKRGVLELQVIVSGQHRPNRRDRQELPGPVAK